MAKIVLETPDEWNRKIDKIASGGYRVLREGEGIGKYNKSPIRRGYAMVSEKATKVSLTMKEPGSSTSDTYEFYLTGEPKYEEYVVGNCARELGRIYKPKDYGNNSHKIGTAIPILGYRPEFQNMRFEAWEYDLKSAYSWAMVQPIPDTLATPKRNAIIENNEVGFNRIIDENGKVVLETEFEVGKKADYIFPLMPSPYVEFVEKYYKLKETSSGVEKIKAKAMLNVGIGNFQNHNPFLRACIVNRANKRILENLDENSVYWNTDAIVSKVRRPDLEGEEGLGSFSIKHHDDFAYKGFTYQWGKEIPGWRGVPKIWFEGKEWDILTMDAPPERHNPYVFNWENLYVEENKEWNYHQD